MSAEYTQADLAEAARLAPTLGSKAHERIARALAERTGLSDHLEPYGDAEFARALEQLKRRNPIAGRAFAAGIERLQRERDAARVVALTLSGAFLRHELEDFPDTLKAFDTARAYPEELLDHG